MIVSYSSVCAQLYTCAPGTSCMNEVAICHATWLFMFAMVNTFSKRETNTFSATTHLNHHSLVSTPIKTNLPVDSCAQCAPDQVL